MTRSIPVQNASLDNDFGATKGPNTPDDWTLAIWCGEYGQAESFEMPATGGYARRTIAKADWAAASGGYKQTSAPVTWTSTAAWSDTGTHWQLFHPTTGDAGDGGKLPNPLTVAAAGVVVSIIPRVYYTAPLVPPEPPPPDDPDTPDDPPPPPPPWDGDSEVDPSRIGYRVFPHYVGKSYGDHAAVLSKLNGSGAKVISHLLTPDMASASVEFTQDAWALGIESWFTVGTPRARLSSSQWTDIRNLLTGPLAGMVTKVFGWNEPNHRRNPTDPPTTDWVEWTVEHQRALWTHIQTVNTNLTGRGFDPILVGTPQLWSGNVSTQWADADALVAAGMRRLSSSDATRPYNIIGHHYYPRGNVREADYVAQYNGFKARFGAGVDLPFVTTEAGLFTAPNYTGGAVAVSESTQAAELVELCRIHQEHGWWLSIFELLDDPDPTGAERESSLGVIRTPSLNSSTWTNKPAYNAIRNLLI